MGRAIPVLIAAGLSAGAFAAPYSWVTWNAPQGQTVTGTIPIDGGTVGVTLTGPFESVVQNYPSWNPATTWADGSIIDNAPDVHNIVQIQTTGDFTLTFSQQVSDLAFSVWSLGGGSEVVTYAFDHDLSFIAGGPSAEFGGTSITTTANSLSGAEANGTVLFAGPLTSLSWNVDKPENWHGFSLGLQSAQPAPEPLSIVALSLGLAALARKRRR